MLRSELQLRHRRQSRHPWLMMPPIAACMAIFRPLPSSFMLWARRNASSPKTAASSCCSSIFFLSKILPNSLRAILCVTAQSRDVLRRILPDVDGSLCNGNFYCEKCIVLRMLFLLLLQFLPSEAFFQRLRYFIQIFDDIPSLTVLCYLEPPFSSIFSSSPQL